jgi:hypothetical protein
LDNIGMRPIQAKQLDYDLTPTAGLALVGHHLKTPPAVRRQRVGGGGIGSHVLHRRRLRT